MWLIDLFFSKFYQHVTSNISTSTNFWSIFFLLRIFSEVKLKIEGWEIKLDLGDVFAFLL